VKSGDATISWLIHKLGQSTARTRQGSVANWQLKSTGDLGTKKTKWSMQQQHSAKLPDLITNVAPLLLQNQTKKHRLHDQYQTMPIK